MPDTASMRYIFCPTCGSAASVLVREKRSRLGRVVARVPIVETFKCPNDHHPDMALVQAQIGN